MFYKNSIASSIENESDYKSEINQNDSDKENTFFTKQQKTVRIADKHYSFFLSSEQSIIIMLSYLVRAEKISVQENMRIQKHSFEDV